MKGVLAAPSAPPRGTRRYAHHFVHADESEGVLEERVYYCQNYRGDIASIHKHDGMILERIHYSAYGVPFLCGPGDVTQDGRVGHADLALLMSAMDSYTVVADFNLDGVVDHADLALLLGNWNTTHGRGMLSTAAVGNYFGYAGYRHDEAVDTMAHVRHRVYLTEDGRWTRRDPLGYVDGMSLYEYVHSSPVAHHDALGLASAAVAHRCSGSGCPGGIIIFHPISQRCHCAGGSRNGCFVECPNVSGPCTGWVHRIRKKAECRCAIGGHRTPCRPAKEVKPKNKPRAPKVKPKVKPKIPFIPIKGIADCAGELSDCLEKPDSDLQNYYALCGRLGTQKERDSCYKNADRAYRLDAAYCSAEYLACSARELLPF